MANVKLSKLMKTLKKAPPVKDDASNHKPIQQCRISCCNIRDNRLNKKNKKKPPNKDGLIR